MCDRTIEELAKVLWDWNREFGVAPVPYEMLASPTKDDLRELARRFRAVMDASDV